MKYLTIIRHAKSSWENLELDDFDRPLNDRGKQAILLIGNYLKQQKTHPDLILSSPAKRAKKTAQGIAKLVNYRVADIQYEQTFYDDGLKAIIALIQQTENHYNDIFLFGHEPILSALIYHFTTTNLEKFPTCAVFRMKFDTNNWSDLSAKKANCEFYVNPKLLLKK
ncbi:MAG: histidine phosphatase family protein [Chitinophagales bacterium]